MGQAREDAHLAAGHMSHPERRIYKLKANRRRHKCEGERKELSHSGISGLIDKTD